MTHKLLLLYNVDVLDGELQMSDLAAGGGEYHGLRLVDSDHTLCILASNWSISLEITRNPNIDQSQVAIYLLWMDVGFYLEVQNLPVRQGEYFAKNFVIK